MKDQAPIPSCSFPGCKQHPYRNGYCLSHNKIYGSLEVKKERKPIEANSQRRKKLQVEYVKLVKQMLQGNRYCEIKAPGCTHIAGGLHHIVKRSEKNLMDKNNLVRACNACNLYVELNVQWAVENGFVKSKHIKADETKNT